jgi:hypothetical protein
VRPAPPWSYGAWAGRRPVRSLRWTGSHRNNDRWQGRSRVDCSSVPRRRAAGWTGQGCGSLEGRRRRMGRATRPLSPQPSDARGPRHRAAAHVRLCPRSAAIFVELPDLHFTESLPGQRFIPADGLADARPGPRPDSLYRPPVARQRVRGGSRPAGELAVARSLPRRWRSTTTGGRPGGRRCGLAIWPWEVAIRIDDRA